MKQRRVAACCAAAWCAAAIVAAQAPQGTGSMSRIAEQYVKLVLALGQHDADYVDAYYGPPEWKKAAESSKEDLPAIGAKAAELPAELARQHEPSDEMERLRLHYLQRQLSALTARVRMLTGERLSFDEESRALYDAVAPTLPESHFQRSSTRSRRASPERSARRAVRRVAARFVIARDKLDPVFQRAIQAWRERTRSHIGLPPEERFTVEYVAKKSWSGIPGIREDSAA